MVCRSLPILALTLALAASAQTLQPVSAAPAPQNPVAFLSDAAAANGLHGDSVQPWHIHASWQTFDSQKNIVNQGAFEEWSAGPRARIALSANGYQQTRYVNGHEIFFTGSDAPSPDNIFGLLEDAIRLPLPSPAAADLKIAPVRQGSLELQCVSADSGRPNPAALPGRLASAYDACFTGNPPVLRMEAGVEVQAILNSLVRFQDRYLARDIRFVEPGGHQTEIHFDVIQPMNPVVDALFNPPAGARPLPERVQIPEDILRASRIGGHMPDYPIYARQNAMVGTVVLDVVVRKDGTVGNLSLVSGAPFLSQASIEAVRTWRYRPYLLNGQPVDVDTQIHITFSYADLKYSVTAP
jgi:TonB family protein